MSFTPLCRRPGAQQSGATKSIYSGRSALLRAGLRQFGRNLFAAYPAVNCRATFIRHFGTGASLSASLFLRPFPNFPDHFREAHPQARGCPDRKRTYMKIGTGASLSTSLFLRPFPNFSDHFRGAHSQA